MKIYCVYDNYAREHGNICIEDIDEIFFNENECEEFVNNLNKKVCGGYDYEEADVRFHYPENSDVIVMESMRDDDKYATEVTCGGTRILPPENHLVGTVEQTERGFVVEFIDKSKI